MGSIPFFAALLASGLSANPIFKILLAIKSRQTISQFAPDGHQKKQGTPTMGGLILLVGMITGFAILSTLPTGFRQEASCALILTVVFGLIGFVDDFVVPRMMPGTRGLGWKQKIIMQFGGAFFGLLPLYGTTKPLLMGVGVFLVLFFSNAYNFSDGLDGLAGSILLALCGGIAGVGVFSDQWFEVQAAMILAASVVPFLFLNAPPAKIFMGDVGSLAVGAVLGLLFMSLGTGFLDPVAGTPGTLVHFNDVVRGGGRQGLVMLSPVQGILALVVLAGMMIVELVPVPIQIASVKLRKKKVFPYTPVHHAFEKAGWPETRVVFVFALFQVVCSLLAIFLITSKV